ncbi:hypothetical protein C8Q70DRAFT_1053224 [Cubamyces menziesii]|nr:hypothetical protein C8Q70DRAFT_1053224 [Cubamyces menziesii]
MGKSHKDSSGKRKRKQIATAIVPPRHLAPLPAVASNVPAASINASAPINAHSQAGNESPPATQNLVAQGSGEHGRASQPDTSTSRETSPPSQADETAPDPRARKQRRKKLTKILNFMKNDTKNKTASEEIQKYRVQARLLPRVVHPFMDPFQALTFGLHHGTPDPTDSEEDSDTLDDPAEEEAARARQRQRAREKELMFQYWSMLELIPDLKSDLPLLDDEELRVLCDYLKHNIKSTRSNDSGRLLDHVMTYMQNAYKSCGDEKYRSAPGPSLQKYARGWTNWYTARLLCPQALLKQFDEDWERFAEQVMSNSQLVRGGNFPSFLYDQPAAEADPTDEAAGLLMGEYLSMSHLDRACVGINDIRPPRTDAGQPPVAFAYNYFLVTERTIAYTAVVVRGALSNQTQFSTQDCGKYNASHLFDTIVELFEHPGSEFAQRTLGWWNERVFGRMGNLRQIAAAGDDEETTADRLRAARRAERKAARAAEKEARAPDVRTPSPSF